MVEKGKARLSERDMQTINNKRKRRKVDLPPDTLAEVTVFEHQKDS